MTAETGVPSLLSRFLAGYPAKLLLALLSFVLTLLALEGGVRLFFYAKHNLFASHDVFELYAVGDSTMEGTAGGTTLPEAVAKIFDGRLQGREISVINTARSGEMVYSQYVRFRLSSLHRRKSTAAALLLYQANNDSILDNSDDETFFRFCRLQRFLAKSVLAEWLTYQCRRNNLFGLSYPPYGRCYVFYLARIIETAKENGIEPVLATVSPNLSDAEPTVEMNPVLLKSVRSGLALEKKGLYREAELVYDNILATHLLKDNRAYFIYRKAKARLKSGDCRAAACRSYFGRL